jgi:hypothetical protein
MDLVRVVDEEGKAALAKLFGNRSQTSYARRWQRKAIENLRK